MSRQYDNPGMSLGSSNGALNKYSVLDFSFNMAKRLRLIGLMYHWW
ncbi:hypothetical protein PRUB_b0381 [Pseudoalteromonas rubra]|uniref:Uncharacterized protein n=1 Tax=Pseudoalteromonas rubra TaxID=43658 RepID=A0A8T0C1V6_9GAMM|nr:hypothetical protein PRUB_b0381 [Pseudoalteromonas rubra]